MGSLRLGVLASGRGSNLQSLLDASERKWIQSKVEIVITDVAGAPALDRARKAQIPVETVPPSRDLKGDARKRLHNDQIGKVLEHFRVDLVVLAGYMRIVGPTLIRRFPNRIINIHPALLPSFPGLHAQRQALDAGVRVAGCTTHFVDELVDHGPVILQAAVPVKSNDTEESLSQRILAVEHQLLPRTVSLVEEGRIAFEDGRVKIQPGPSWKASHPVLPEVLYGDGY